MRRLTLISVILLLLAGCHSSGGDQPTATGTATTSPPSTGTSGTPGPSGPSCADIWIDGATLPKDYTTCNTDGTTGAQDVTRCKDGTKLIAYSDAYYAITGGKISKPTVAPMQDTPEFGKVYAACTGK